MLQFHLIPVVGMGFLVAFPRRCHDRDFPFGLQVGDDIGDALTADVDFPHHLEP